MRSVSPGLRRPKSESAGISTVLVKNGIEEIQSSLPPSRRCRIISRPASCSVASANDTFAR